MSKYKGPFRWDRVPETDEVVIMDNAGSILNARDIVALLNHSLTDAVPEGWRLGILNLIPCVFPADAYYKATLYKGASLNQAGITKEVFGTGPTPELALADAASKCSGEKGG